MNVLLENLTNHLLLVPKSPQEPLPFLRTNRVRIIASPFGGHFNKLVQLLTNVAVIKKSDITENLLHVRYVVARIMHQ